MTKINYVVKMLLANDIISVWLQLFDLYSIESQCTGVDAQIVHKGLLCMRRLAASANDEYMNQITECKELIDRLVMLITFKDNKVVNEALLVIASIIRGPIKHQNIILNTTVNVFIDNSKQKQSISLLDCLTRLRLKHQRR